MKTYLNSIALLLSFFTLKAQQLPSWSSFFESGFIWNPALTARNQSNEALLTHRQDWLGFEGAPQIYKHSLSACIWFWQYQFVFIGCVY